MNYVLVNENQEIGVPTSINPYTVEGKVQDQPDERRELTGKRLKGEFVSNMRQHGMKVCLTRRCKKFS